MNKNYILFLVSLCGLQQHKDLFSSEAAEMRELAERRSRIEERDTARRDTFDLIYYTLEGKVKKIEEMVRRGVNLNALGNYNYTNRAPLHVASGDMTQHLINLGADVNVQDDSNRTPLHLAASSDDLEKINILLDHGASVHIKDNQGRIPLFYAHSKDVAEALIRHGADVNARDNLGFRPLDGAANLDHVQLLIDSGANINAQSNSGTTALGSALLRSQRGKAELLKRAGARVTEKDTEIVEADSTMRSIRDLFNQQRQDLQDRLYQAVNTGDTELARRLVNEGADIHAQDETGYSVLQKAAWEGNEDMQNALLGRYSLTDV